MKGYQKNFQNFPVFSADPGSPPKKIVKNIKLCAFSQIEDGHFHSCQKIVLEWPGDHNFCKDIVVLDRLISISYMGTFKFEDQCLITQLKLSMQGITNTGIEEEFNPFLDYSSTYKSDYIWWSQPPPLMKL